MAKSLFTFAEDPDSVPCTHVTDDSHLQLEDQEIQSFPLASVDIRHVCGTYNYMLMWE